MDIVYRIRNKHTGVFYGGPERIYSAKPNIDGFAPSWKIVAYKLVEIENGSTSPQFEDKEERP